MRTILILTGMLSALVLHAQNWAQAGIVNEGINYLYSDSINGNLYLGGPFRYVNGTSVNGICLLDCLGALHTLGSGQDNCGPFNCDPIKIITRYKDEHYVSWTNKTIGGGIEVNGIARWDGNAWKSLNNGFNFPSAANGFMEHEGDLYVAGAYTIDIDSVTHYGIAKWNGTAWTGFGFPNYPNDAPLSQAAAWYKGKLYLAGGFLFPLGDNGDYILDIASFDGQQWSPVADGIKGGLWHGINDMVVYKDELYVCGLFRQIDGNAGNKIMRWNGTQWKDVGGGICDPDATLHHMLIHDDKLYVTGIFTCVGDGIPASCIASWDGERWCSYGNSVFNNRVLSIAFWHDTMYIGGGFTEIDGQPVNYFAKWIGDHSTDTCSAPVSVQKEPSTASTLQISPNPAGDQLRIQWPGGEMLPNNLRVFDASGKDLSSLTDVVINAQTATLRTGRLAPGLYFLQVGMGDGRVWSGRFVKR